MALVAELKVRFTTDDASDTTPTWTDVSTLVRSFSISRGRANELADVDAGTATLVLDNGARTFDPISNALIRPMNRWWIQSIVAGVTRDMFFGYADSYTNDVDGGAWGDAVATVQLTDEMKVLALGRLPAMDPPRDTYADVVLSDEPRGYWRFQETAKVDDRIFAPAAGDVSMTFDTNVSRSTGAIVGDDDVDIISGTYYGSRSTTIRFFTIEGTEMTTVGWLPVNGPGDAAGLSAFTFEMWFSSDEATPAAQREIVMGPLSGGVTQWGIQLTTAGLFRGYARNSGGTAYVALGTNAVSAGTFYHVVFVVAGSTVHIYVNGVLEGSSGAFTGTVGVMDSGGFLQLGPPTAVGGTRAYDEAAFYSYALGADRVLAHFNAGRNRGFAKQDPGARITAVLTAAGNTAATSIRAGSREMIPTFMRGQSPLEEMRKAETADSVDSVLFISKSGTITFLDDGHRSVSPWNTVQATFDDDGTDTAYLNVTFDFSEAFLYNSVNVTRTGGTTSTTSDSTSISKYFKRTLSYTDLPITTDSDASAIGTALLAKYKDPMWRIVALELDTSTAAVAAAGLAREIGDRIRILRTPPGGGTRLDQTSFVQKIGISGQNDWRPWKITLTVSPL
jgi:hypothetical protein